VRLFHVDAFTEEPFAGNPAAVCLLDGERDARWMQAVAREMNLSETAFVGPERHPDGGFPLRWFTPAVEVDLCGHATLASAFVLWHMEACTSEETIRFATRSGELAAVRDGEWVELDFPRQEARRVAPPPGLVEALGVQPLDVGSDGADYLVLVDDEDAVRGCEPDFRALASIGARGVMVTAGAAEGDEADFVSRFFAPAVGIEEDPVTGSAHTALAPFWSRRLGRDELTGLQASARSGLVRTALRGDRTLLTGTAVTVIEGELLATA
jgi:PhzF family phenazine biosynthesis protein